MLLLSHTGENISLREQLLLHSLDWNEAEEENWRDGNMLGEGSKGE